MTLDRIKLSAQTVRDNIAILEECEEPDDAGYYLQLEHEKFVLECIEKQISEKPIRANRAIEKDGQLFMNDDNEYWKCPICTGYDVPLRENQQYCHYCGQKIDWSDTE